MTRPETGEGNAPRRTEVEVAAMEEAATLNPDEHKGEGNAPSGYTTISDQPKYDPMIDGEMPKEFPVRMSIKLANYYKRCEAQRDELLRQIKALAVQLEMAGMIVPPGVKTAIKNAEVQP